MSKKEAPKSAAYKKGWRAVFDRTEGEVRTAENALAATGGPNQLTKETLDYWRGERDAGIAACKNLSGKLRTWAEEERDGEG